MERRPSQKLTKMSPLRLVSLHVACLLLAVSLVDAQYNSPPPPYDPYNRNGNPPYNNDPYNRDPYNNNRSQNGSYYGSNQYDRGQNNQNDRYGPYNNNNNYNQSQYNRDSPYNPYNGNNNNNNYNQSQYNRNPPYNSYNNQYNQSNYNRYNQTYNGNQGPYNQDPYNRNSYNNNNPPYGSNRDQYGNPYGLNRDQNGNPRDPYNKDPYNRDPYNKDPYNRDPYNKDPYNRDPYNKDPYNRDPYNKDPYNKNTYNQPGQPYDPNRDKYMTGNKDPYNNFGGPQYGSPIIDTNDNCCKDYCYTQDPQPYIHFATKTAYEVVYGKQSNQHNVPDCTPVQFWSINRHGTRFPSPMTIYRLRELQKLHMEIIRNYDDRNSYPDRGRLCPSDLDLFRKWHWNESISVNNANGLTSQGIDDLKFLARRYATRFENLMREPYSEQTYSFQYTDSDKTHDSYQAYIEGLFRDKAYQVHANMYSDDKLIRPTASCNAWLREVGENPQSLSEYYRFKQRPEYQQMVRDVFRRLGFRYTLNESVVTDMYDMCRFEKAWNLQAASPWCLVFNQDQLRLIEYAEDLKFYYKYGYGNELNRKVGCPPIRDLYEKFERTVNGDTNGNKVTVFFTHSATIQTFLTAMGIAQDNMPLTSQNYFEQHSRKWRTSIIDPFASNLAAVLYQCRSGERHRVMFFLNEVPVNYPECAVGLCNWSDVQKRLQNIASYCTLDFCNWNAATALEHRYVIYVISLVAILFTYFRM